jgi:hypothetical protein
MSPNGTLMAYSAPVDIKDLRDQAALTSMAWKEYETSFLAKQADAAAQSEQGQSAKSKGLETLTIEFQHNNIIVRALQPKLLLVLVGGVPPSRRTFFKITPEAYGSPRYPTIDTADTGPSTTNLTSSLNASTHSLSSTADQVGTATPKAASIFSTMSQKEKDVKVGVLHIQRKKIDALTQFIRADFDSKGFMMPDDSSLP